MRFVAKLHAKFIWTMCTYFQLLILFSIAHFICNRPFWTCIIFVTTFDSITFPTAHFISIAHLSHTFNQNQLRIPFHWNKKKYSKNAENFWLPKQKINRMNNNRPRKLKKCVKNLWATIELLKLIVWLNQFNCFMNVNCAEQKSNLSNSMRIYFGRQERERKRTYQM